MSPRYTDGAAVETRYPRTPGEEAGPRESWPWLPGTVLEQCGPDEWDVEISVPEMASPDGCLPSCFRGAAEIRPAHVSAFRCPCCGDDVMGTPPLCADCRAAGCEPTRDAAGDTDWWSCQRDDAGNHP